MLISVKGRDTGGSQGGCTSSAAPRWGQPPPPRVQPPPTQEPPPHLPPKMGAVCPGNPPEASGAGRAEYAATPPGPPPPAHATRHTLAPRSLLQPQPPLVRTQPMIQAQKIEQITAPLPRVAIPALVTRWKDLKARSHIPPIMVALERTGTHPAPIKGHIPTDHRQHILRPAPGANPPTPTRPGTQLIPTIQTITRRSSFRRATTDHPPR